MIDYSNDYRMDELFVATLSRQIRDGERVFFGLEQMLCVMAWFLAKETHAPNSSCFLPVGSIDIPVPSKMPYSTVDPCLLDGALTYISLAQAVGLARLGWFNIVFLSAVQIDKYGNLNNSVIGDFKQPHRRLPGPAGGAELVNIIERVIFYRSKHTRRVFVEKSDFVTDAAGSVSGDSLRRGLERIITNLAVMEYDKDAKQMKLESVHPGVTVEDVKMNTGFDLIIPRQLSYTEPPTKEQVELLRTKIDPHDIRKHLY